MFSKAFDCKEEGRSKRLRIDSSSFTM
jgi:hypothetical protein